MKEAEFNHLQAIERLNEARVKLEAARQKCDDTEKRLVAEAAEKMSELASAILLEEVSVKRAENYERYMEVLKEQGFQQ